jgi:hypothetical protein
MRHLATAIETCHIIADKLISHACDFALRVLNCGPEKLLKSSVKCDIMSSAQNLVSTE